MMRTPTTTTVAALTAFGLAAAIAVTGCQDETDLLTETAPVGDYVSRPDLDAVEIDVETFGPSSSTMGDGLVFLAPKEGEPRSGPLIVDNTGEPVWIGPEDRSYDFRVQEYEGERVLTWWRGDNVGVGYGVGEYVIADDSYEEIATVTTKGIQPADYHGMTLTDDGTALLISVPTVRRDLTSIGGPANGYVLNGVVQEVDVETGEVLFEWRALDHIPLSDTRIDVQTNEKMDGTADAPLDFVHINSVTKDGDGWFLISARQTCAVYRVDRRTGDIEWTLGGSASDFAMETGAAFAWQHDAQRQADGTLTLFDNEAGPAVDDQSRGLRLDLDMKSMTAEVVTEYLPPDDRLSESQGNLQQLPNGNVFIGWGSEPNYSEYAADGRLMLDAAMDSGESYRTYRTPWVAEPSAPPDLVVEDGTAYVSWNGATEVAAWRFVAGEDAASAEPVATARRTGFETSADVGDAAYVEVEALDADGRVLAGAET
jgi:arylsulfotransferase ASST